MGEAVANTTEKAPKKSWFKGLKAEFKKIVWPDKESLVKQPLAVVAVSIALGIIIAALDYLLQSGIGLIL